VACPVVTASYEAISRSSFVCFPCGLSPGLLSVIKFHPFPFRTCPAIRVRGHPLLPSSHPRPGLIPRDPPVIKPPLFLVRFPFSQNPLDEPPSLSLGPPPSPYAAPSWTAPCAGRVGISRRDTVYPPPRSSFRLKSVLPPFGYYPLPFPDGFRDHKDWILFWFVPLTDRVS